MPGKNKKRMEVRVNDKRRYWRLRTILAYESEMGSKQLGQTMCDIVLEAADIESYPEIVRRQIKAIDDEAEQKAVERGIERALRQSKEGE